jgi:predicted DNA-binding protein (UPF0251 family)
MMPRASFFKPAGVPARLLEQVELTVDEVEALRLTDVERLSQEEAARRLGVSRQTVGRVVDSAHRKVADALVNGKALAIGGGPYRLACGGPDDTQQQQQQESPGRTGPRSDAAGSQEEGER